MGNKFEIHVYKDGVGYIYFWNCDSFFEALWYMRKAKKEGYKCIKLEWRP